MTVAKRRYVDGVRREVTLERKVEQMGRELRESHDPLAEVEVEDHVDDDVLRLMFTACHPVLAREARVALALKTLAGLSTEAVARAFLVPTATMAQRLVRAKRALKDNAVRFEVPVGEELRSRFGRCSRWSTSSSTRATRRRRASSSCAATCARRRCDSGRTLAVLAPDEPEVHALVALMELQASRLRARTGPDGAIVTLLDQDRTRWDRLLITHALAALDRARELGPGRGWYLLQAEMAACHARAATPGDTDWVRIASLYGALARLAPSPVVELNRAVAVSMADGPAAALPLVDALADEPALRAYHLLPSVRGDLLYKLGGHAEARLEFERAAGMTQNAREREHLLERARACG